jgi:hypothetical protein
MNAKTFFWGFHYEGLRLEEISDAQIRDSIQRKVNTLAARGLCKFCGKYTERSEADIVHGYWTPLMGLTHKLCKKEGYANEAYECQKIDMNCNECKHFSRGDSLGSGIFSGYCNKLNKPTEAQSNFSSREWHGECFEHRKG